MVYCIPRMVKFGDGFLLLYSPFESHQVYHLRPAYPLRYDEVLWEASEASCIHAMQIMLHRGWGILLSNKPKPIVIIDD